VVVVIQAGELNDIGIAFDFVELKEHLSRILNRFDHTCLNEIPPFDKLNPSSENIAATIYHELQAQLKGTPVSISSIEVWESPEACVTYTP
jgi:6-pyruvoyltetrahydropterin/6-carboxytetrahydropterin synthase